MVSHDFALPERHIAQDLMESSPGLLRNPSSSMGLLNVDLKDIQFMVS